MEWFYLYLVTKIGWILLPDQTHASEMQKFGIFDGIFDQKWANFENVFQRIVWTIFLYNLANFHVSSTFLSRVDLKSVILSNRTFKSLRNPF